MVVVDVIYRTSLLYYLMVYLWTALSEQRLAEGIATRILVLSHMGLDRTFYSLSNSFVGSSFTYVDVWVDIKMIHFLERVTRMEM